MGAVNAADGSVIEHVRSATTVTSMTAHPPACAIGRLDGGTAAHEAAWKASLPWSCVSAAAARVSSGSAHTRPCVANNATSTTTRPSRCRRFMRAGYTPPRPVSTSRQEVASQRGLRRRASRDPHRMPPAGPGPASCRENKDRWSGAEPRDLHHGRRAGQFTERCAGPAHSDGCIEAFASLSYGPWLLYQ